MKETFSIFSRDTARVMFFTSEIDFIISGEKRLSLWNEVPFELCTIFSFFAKSNCLFITKKQKRNKTTFMMQAMTNFCRCC